MQRGFVRFSYYKTANCIAPCSAMHYYVRCSYAILQTILVRFLLFVWFNEHPLSITIHASFDKNHFPVWYPLNQFIHDSCPPRVCLIDSSNFNLRSVRYHVNCLFFLKTSVINSIPLLSSQTQPLFL